MSAPFSVKGVANAFLKRSFDDGVPVSPMKLQKLVFLAHGYHLAVKNGEPLVSDSFEAWPFGPVSEPLYHEFKSYGGDSIDELATEFSGEFEKGELEVVPVRSSDTDPSSKKITDFVWNTYKNWSARELSDLTHKRGWAWDRIREEHPNQRSLVIPNEYIRNDFREAVKKKSEVAA